MSGSPVYFAMIPDGGDVAQSIMVVLPTIGLLIGCAIMLFYPLRHGMHESIVEQLEARRRDAPVQLTSDATD